MSVKLKCPECGGKELKIPSRMKPKSKSICGKCGYVETYDKTIKRVEDIITDAVNRELENIYK